MSRDRQRDRRSSKSPHHHDYMIKLRGIPYSSNKDDVKKFLHPCHVVTVHLFSNRGCSSGDCYVELESEIDVKDALKKNRKHMGKRYIEIFRATTYECNFYIKHKGTLSWNEPVIRMNGLPYTCTMADVQHFFGDIEIARNGIYITRDMSDKALGDGFVVFVNMDSAYEAIDHHNQKHIQHRYIELFPSTYDEAKTTIVNDANLNAKRFAGESEHNAQDSHSKNKNNKNNGRNRRSPRRSPSTSRNHQQQQYRRRHHSPSASPRPRSRPQPKSSKQPESYDNTRRQSRSRSPIRGPSPVPNDNGEFLVKMRGMPYNVTEEDIRKFFPAPCRPVRIVILQDRRTDRPSGDAKVYFGSLDDAQEAMKYDRKYIGNRYVELYLESSRHSSPVANYNSRRSRSDGSPRRSPSESNMNGDDRSRSGSIH